MRAQWVAEAGTEFVRMLTSEPATSTPIVPTTMRWIHCLASSAVLASTAVIFQMNAKINASAPIEPTSAWPMWIQLLIRSVSGAMSGVAARMFWQADWPFSLVQSPGWVATISGSVRSMASAI